MSTPKSVSFFSSITTKITIALLISFSLVALLIFYVVEKEGHVKIQEESERLIVQKGEGVVNLISFDISSVMRSAAQLKDIGEILPLERESFENGVDKVFVENNITLLGSGGVWPDAYNLDPAQAALPLLRRRDAGKYIKVPITDSLSNYLTASWYKTTHAIRPQTCFWNHATWSFSANDLAISCGLSIERGNEFWGAVSVNFILSSVQKSVESLKDKIGEGYVVLIDNSNRIIATAGSDKLTSLDAVTGDPVALKSLLEVNPAWQPVYQGINQHRQTVIDDVSKKLPPPLIEQLGKYDDNMGTPDGSMLINYAAYLQTINPNIPNISPTYFDTYTLNNESIYHADARAYVFTVPETLWKLVIVKPTSDVNAIADNLRNNLAKYLVFALIATAALIFLLLDFLALRPLQETTKSILKAETLIDANKYNKLSEVEFINTGGDEIGIVNNSLNSLLERIESNEGKLANVNQELEVKVEARTQELQQTLKELKNSQVQLIRSEKMATLGQMVAGVAHEVNTPLSYVQNNLEIVGQLTEMYDDLIEDVSTLKSAMFDEDTPEAEVQALMGKIMSTADELQQDNVSDELKEVIKDSLFGVEQITEMVLNLRNFARLDESKVKKISVNECIESSLKITHNATKHLHVVTDFAVTPEIKCSPSQINQVLVNLINNAAQAIAQQSDGEIKIRTLSDTNHVYIEVQDNGSGMSPEVQAKIFEPFFTTKAAGEGTGLGMAICQQIIEQHGGTITIESEVDKGTTFRLTLPIDNDLST